MYDHLIKKAEFESAQKIATQAGKYFNDVQIKVNKEKVVASERVGWFCAGAISLSFTLIGYLFSNIETRQVIASDLFVHVPLIGLLIVGWMNLAVSVVASLLVRFWNALYLNYNGAQYWSSKNKELKDKALQAIEGGVPFVFTDANDSTQATVNVMKDRDSYSSLEKVTSQRAKYWLRFLNLAQALIYIGAVFGLVLLSIFLMVVTTRLVYF